MTVLKGTKIEYWDELDDAGKANKFFRLSGYDPTNTRRVHKDKEFPCKICNRKLKKDQRTYPSSNATVQAHDFCVDDNRTLTEADNPDKKPETETRRPSNVQSLSPRTNTPAIVAAAFGSVESERVLEDRKIQQNVVQSGQSDQLNEPFRRMIWNLGIKHMNELMQSGASFDELLKLYS